MSAAFAPAPAGYARRGYLRRDAPPGEDGGSLRRCSAGDVTLFLFPGGSTLERAERARSTSERTVKETAMEAEPEPQRAPKPEASSGRRPVEPVATPQLVVVATGDAAAGVCNLDGECS